MISPQTRPATLTSLLGFRAAEQPEREAYVFLSDAGEHAGEKTAARLTWGELDRRARAIAIALRESLQPGDRALLLYPPGLEFVAAFFGCLQAGVVAVPAYPPRLHDRSQTRLRAIARDAEPRAALTTSAILAALAESPLPELAAVRWIATEGLAGSGTELPEPDPESVAFLQYTSGSTATPKGVMVTHANLVHNERMIGEAFDQDESSVVVGWLPLYHDMGLIGNVLQPLHAGARCVLMSPVAFLQRPRRWLEAVSRYRGTTSGGPNFAYELCVRRIPPEQREGLDLSSWRAAFNGAEPVRAETMERFAEAFAPCGFRAEAFYPCYGLAEATLFVTGEDAGRPPRVEDRRVSCGRAWGGQRIAVVDPEAGIELPPGLEGEIWVEGPSVARGYWRNPEATERDFHARLAGGEGPFLRTGDLGLLRGGELYVTGRIKDLIILRGRNHYPQDIELTAERSHPDLRPGGGAAFSVDVMGEERLVVVQEVERRRRSGLEELSEAVRRAVAEEHEVQVHEVVLVRAGTVPKTSSGKVQRRLCREHYLNGELQVLGRSAVAAPRADSGPVLTREALAGLDPEERRAVLERWLRERAAAAMGVAAEEIDPERPLTAFGLDSLAAMELKGSAEAALGVTLPLADLLEGAGTARLAGLLLQAEPVEAPRVPSGEEHGRLSYGQKALWFLHRLAPEGGAYNIAVAARARGLDPERLLQALTTLAARHPALRTVFPAEGDEPVRKVLDDRPEIDFATGEWTAEEAYRPFDLERGPLLRVRVFEREDGEQELLFAVHHIVADFASLAIMAKEMARKLNAPALPDLPWTYADFVLRQEEELSGPRGERLWERWRETLAGVPDLDLPTDRPRPPVQTWSGGARALELPPDLADGVRALAAEHGATLFMALLAAFQAQLGRYSGQRDFAVGSPAPGRDAPEWAGLVGYFVNPVALRTDLEGDPGFGALLDRARRTVLEGLEGAGFPFPLIAERLRPVRDPARSPLFQAMFLLQKARPGDPPGLATFALGEEGGTIELGGVEIESLRLDERRAQFDLTLRVAEGHGGLRASLEYNSDLFDADTAGRMLGHLRTLLAGAVAEPGRPLSLLPLLDDAELRQILVWGTMPEPPGPRELLHRRFEEHAALAPDAEALVAGTERLTYAELNRRANRLARHLRGLGVGPEVRVGVALERSAGLVVSLLAVLKAGGAYVPLDPAYPRERLDLMLEDSGAKVLIREEDLEIEGDGSDLDPVAVPENLAYLIYTSGSTGRPKAVAIEHRSASVMVAWARQVFGPEELAGVLASTSVAFDLSVFELFVPLSWGGRVILAANALELPRLSDVTLVNTVPSALSELVRSGGIPPSVRTVNLAGEPVPPPLVEAVRVERLYNLYGPSEDTTYSTFTRLKPGNPVTIGRPIDGTRAYVLDAAMQPVPAGIPGELYLGGEGLARGYLGRPELTAERFLPDQGGERLYRTGDLVRWRNGDLDFLGRIDHQVKVRGFRIELGEVEAALARQPGVRDAVVVARGEGENRRLVAYVVGEVAELRDSLRRALPEFMVPAAFVRMDTLPLSPNGKVDRKALPDPEPVQTSLEVPQTPLQELLAGVLAEVLGLERVGLHDDFFDLGGHSLLATRVSSRVSRLLGVDLPVSALFQEPTVAGLAERISSAAPAGPPLQPVSRDALPLSFAQRRLWFLDRLEPGSAAYNLPGAVLLTGPLDVPALALGLAEVVRRHEALRTVFPVVDGEPVQSVGPVMMDLPRIDLRGLPELRVEGERLAQEEAQTPFDLARGPVCRAKLLRLDKEEHLLLVTLHHIAADGWSLGIFLHELASLYEGKALPDLPVQYADYAVWQRGLPLEGQLAYWRERLAGLPVLELPADRPRPAVRDLRGAVRSLALAPELAAAVGKLARGEGTTLFMAVLAVFQTLLARYTGEDAVPVGSPVANRRNVEVEPLIGFFVNTLVLDARLGDDPPIRELLARVREACLGAYAHQDVPFELLVETLQPHRALSQNPLFQVMLVLEEPLPELRSGGILLLPRRVENGTAKFDLTLAVTPQPDGGWLASAEHAVALFDPGTIDRLLGHFRMLLESSVADPGRRLSELPMLDAVEREQLLVEGNQTAGPASVIELFQTRAPEGLAISWPGGWLTHGELRARAERLAAELQAHGVGPEVPVGLHADRSPELVTGALAVLLAGGAYVPLDPSYPPERLAFMAAECGMPVLLTVEEGRPDWLPEGVRAIRLNGGTDGEVLTSPIPESLAYIIYTSGSTGRPKGVQVPHAGLANLVRWHLRAHGLTERDRVTLVAAPAFDASVWEVWSCLAAGASLHIPDEDTRLSPDRLLAWLAAEGITACFLPTPLAEQLLERIERGAPAPPALRALLTGGDRLRRVPPGLPFALINHYGPAESSVVATWGAVESEGERAPAIGRPVDNVRVYVFGRHGEPLPAGVPGELFLGGTSLARGYLGRPALTAERFVPDPFGPAGERLYRTGDRVRLRPDGQLDFLGRLDHQVKIRGVRIELGEVEAVLAGHPSVREAVAMVRGDRLVAWVVSAAEAEELKAFLRERLPEAMVPSAWVFLEALPLSPNGKVYRAALPAPDEADRPAAAPPRTPAEERLAAIWRQVLDVERLGVHDDFFELGGHSLLAVRAAFRISEDFGIDVPVSALFANPTVAGLALWLEGAAPPDSEMDIREEAGPFPISLAQQRLWLIDRLEPGNPAYNQSVAVRLTGDLWVEALARSLAEILRRHEPLRTVFREVEGEPVQVVLPPPAAPLSLIDLSLLPEPDRRPALREAIREELSRPFDLQRGPMARFFLARLSAEEHVLVVTFHHIASDGWSMEVFFRDLIALYGGHSVLPPLPWRYVDFALWQRRALTPEILASQLAYWREQLADASPLDLPTDRPRPARPTCSGAAVGLRLAPDLVESLRTFGRPRGITLFTALLTGFMAVLSRYSGQSDVSVGIPSAGRSRRETEDLIGFFANTLVVRDRAGEDAGFLEAASRIRDLVLAAQRNQDVPFERLVEELQPERDPNVTPLFQAMLTFVSVSREPLRVPGLEASLLDAEVVTAKFDLLLSLMEREGGVSGHLEYGTELFDAPTPLRMAAHLEALLRGAAKDAGRRISEVPLLSEDERHQLVSEWNDTGLAMDTGCAQDLVERQAARMPDSIAVEHGDEALSYQELVERARRLAGVLRGAGAGPDVPVGLWVGRSLALPVGVLGVLEAGGACLPLDPSYPADRLALMVADAGLRLVLAEEAILAELPHGLLADMEVVVVDGRGEVVSGPAWAPPGASPMPDNLVYVLYTSGSTGRPKGVALPHRALVNLIGWTGEVRPDRSLRVLQYSPMSFDVSFEELFSTWASGGTLVLIPDEMRRDPDALLTFLVDRRIDRLFQPFVALQQLAEVAREEGRPPLGLRELVTAGEQLRITPAVEGLFRAGGRLFNEYGPTETHVATAYELQGEPGGWPALPPIGRPIGNHRVRLLDRRLQPVLLGMPGELCIGGAGLARGYFRRPDLTAERFVPDPCEPGARLYRTGDLARLGPGGMLEYLGRIDHQVKLRGFRVELGEIEIVLASHPRVQEAAVLVRGEEGSSSDRRLAAYMTLRSAEEGEDLDLLIPELRRFLGTELPAHMVPSAYVFLDAFPQTPSGKVDRRALARIAPHRQEESAYVAPRNPVEQALADIWAAVLGEERTGGRVGIHDNFFDLGGHSLLASRLIARIRSEFGVELPVRALFEAPTVAGLAERLEGVGGERAETIPRQPRIPGQPQRFPVSFSQLREWILDRLEPGTAAYNVPSPKRITGNFSIPAFALSLQEIVRRHESLRTTFEAGPEEPLQVVAPAMEILLPVIDLEGLPKPSREPELRRLLEEDLRTGFDLERGPLLRIRLVRSAAEDHALFLTMHHIISDGWSSGVLSRELAALYEGFSQGRRARLPELPVQYPDYAAWQRARLQGERLEELVGYWRGQLAGAPPLLELPADRQRPAVRTARGGRLRFDWPASLVAPLRTAAARQGGSLFMALLAAFQTLLARLSGQDDVAVGTFSGNRGRVELEGLIGFFINTLALRTDLSGEPSLRELLGRVREVTLGAYAHQEIPFEKLLESLAVPRDTSRTPIFQTMLVLQNFPRERVELSGITLEPLPFRTQRSNFDLTLWMMEDEEDGGLVCEAEYSTDLFEEATVVRMMGYLKNLVEGAGADPDASLWTLPLMPPAERAQILEGWSRTADEPAGEPLLHRLFEAQAARTPDSIAVKAGEERLTYGELNRRADRLARHLRRLDVGPESRVGLSVDRSPEMLVGMLGVLKAGGAYVPLDPAYPQDRLAYMIEDSGARVILDRERLAELDHDEPGPEPAPKPEEIDPGNAAYVIYTSGSTGRPKGVVVSHRSIAAYTRTARDYYAIGPDDRMLQFGSISFDTSAEEIYPTLIAGATLVLRPDDMALSMSHFLEGLDRFGITVLAMQTAFWHEIVAGLVDGLELPRGLRLLAFGGEEGLPDRLADWRRRVGPGVRLVNTYGPTEATIVSTYRELAEPEDDPEVPIGRAIPGARTYVLDRRLEPVPLGVNGELMIGGVGLARGYLGRPELTAERFIPDPYTGEPGGRLYRTGDLVRFRPDGDLLFRGRADRQLKVRGYRIEPGEIEAALRQHPELRDAVADVRGGGDDKRLVAWVVPRDGDAPPPAELRTFLRDRLPEPMVPSLILAVDALPLTPSGKLDRRALPEPEGVRPDLPGYAEPATALEGRIAGIFRDLLRVDRVGRNDNFFDLGGHSLLVVRAHQRLREALGREIPVVDLFRFPTVALLARHLGSGEEEKPAFQKVQGLAEKQKAAQLRRRQAMEKMRRPGGTKR